eukprot:151293_1
MLCIIMYSYYQYYVLSTHKFPRSPIGINQTSKIYISLTSIFKNQHILLQTLQSIENQTRKTNKIFLYLSEEPYILDTGFKNKNITNKKLMTFIENHNSLIEVKWVKNTGPYRKLLPLLKEKWKEDCIIITIDDDTIYDNNLIKHLLNDYNKHKCVIGYRGFTPDIKFDKIEDFDYLKRKMLQNRSLYNFLTGKGGVLYKPEFFHKTKNLIFDEKIYSDTCSKQDDIWFYILRIMNKVDCYVGNKTWQQKDISGSGLFVKFNGNQNANTKAFRNTIQSINVSLINNYNL